MQTQQLQTMFLCVVLTYSIVSSLTSASSMIFVKPDENTTCPGQTCYTLKYCAYYSNQCFASNSTVYFLAGEHVLELKNYSQYQPLYQYVIIRDKANLRLVGEGAPSTDLFQSEPFSRITCITQVSFYFYNIMNLSMVNLAFINCGAIPPTPAALRGAIILDSITDVSIFNTLVEQSSAFGLIAKNVIGNSVVFGSKFSGNRNGGNMYLTYTNGACSQGTDFTMINIAYSNFSFGHNPYALAERAGGLTIKFQQTCYNVNVNINNVVMHGSTSASKYGGNMFLIFLGLAENSVQINGSHFEAGYAGNGGGLYTELIGNSQCQGKHTLQISKCQFFNNFARVNGGGITLMAEISCVDVQVYIYNTTMSHNKANLGGGHIHINNLLSYEPFKNESFISVKNSSFTSGRAGAIGGGIHIFIAAFRNCIASNIPSSSVPSVHISGIQVFDNSAKDGGGLSINFYYSCFSVNVFIQRVNISGNRATIIGGNVLISSYDAFHSTTSSVTVDNSIIELGSSRDGAGFAVMLATFTAPDVGEPGFPISGPNSVCTMTRVYIENTIFQRNSAKFYGGGLALELQRLQCNYVLVKINNATFLDNVVSTEGTEDSIRGGNIGIYDHSSLPSYNLVEIRNSYIYGGRAWRGGGIAVLQRRIIFPMQVILESTHINTKDLIIVRNTSFWRNNAVDNGADVSIEVATFHNNIQSVDNPLIKQVRVEECTITGWETNVTSIWMKASQSNDITSVVYNAVFSNSVFQGHGPATPRGIKITSFHKVTFINCDFIKSGNRDSAITAIRTNLFFQGSVNFRDNMAVNGGALTLCEGSTMYLKPRTHLLFSHNHAMNAGGAIYVDQKCTSTTSFCFYQIDAPPEFNVSDLDILVQFENNMAKYAGSALYGGNVDRCTPHMFVYGLQNESNWDDRLSRQTFDSIFNFSGNQDASTISSDPQSVCLCFENNITCGDLYKKHSIHFFIITYPGFTFQVNATVIGQRYGIVPGVVHANIVDSYKSASLGNLEDSQTVQGQCTLLNYTVFSSNSSEAIILRAGQLQLINTESLPAFVHVSLQPCPWGFTQTNYPSKCDCAPLLREKHITCSIKTQAITRPPPKWIGYFHSSRKSAGVLLHDNCPFDYCKSEELPIKLNESDAQCAFMRSGILCGACQSGLSLTLGTSQCKECSNIYLALLLAFATAGFALVFLIMICNLTVTEGTINGLIFYANFIHINRAIFFPPGEINVLTVFIAWVNLDLGIETCFYNGMDVYARTWMQFLFPIYIWLIAGAIILSSHYSITAGKLFRKNAVQVLATLFLLSFAKLQHTIIMALSFTYLSYPDGTRKALWLYDGNVEYAHGKHIPLLLVALLTLTAVVIPYTTVLLLAQCLQHHSGYRLLSWVRRLKPFFDAYTGSYKDKYRFWTGLLLIVRTVLFFIFALNSEGEPVFNLLSMILASICLLALAPNVYKKWLLTLLERFFVANLGMISGATLYSSYSHGHQNIVAYTFVGSVLLTFVGIFLYHTYESISIARVWKNLIEWLFHKKTPTSTNAHEMPTLSSDGSNQVENCSNSHRQQQVLIFDQFREPLLVYTNCDRD